ncbi:glycosyltransferase [Formosa undariae]|uniref:Glycosyltransferase n=1 Tax=Formosa undariae TaxID=1325436 RepID=A0ABV5F524_9FLAO
MISDTKLKILHVNSLGFGGAFTGANRLHFSLINYGVESNMIVKELNENNHYTNVFKIAPQKDTRNIFYTVSNKFGYPITTIQKRNKYLNGKKGEFEILSLPFSNYDITKTKFYEDCDIIHLHFVADFLDYKSFFKTCKKPVVLTLRDLFSIQGVFHYHNDVLINEKVYGDLNTKMQNLKQHAISKFKGPLKVVGISNWIVDESKKSKMHANLEHHVIPNCIDINNYRLYDKTTIRAELNISKDHLVLCFISDGLVHKRKGIDLLLDAVKRLDITENITVLTVGGGVPPVFPNKIVHLHLGTLSQPELNRVLSASDACVFPSREEALGNVMLEAMACGIPVIGTPVGGLLDVIKPGFNGVLASEVTSDSLKEAIEYFITIKSEFDSVAIRNYIEENYSEERISKLYIELYKSLLKGKKFIHKNK